VEYKRVKMLKGMVSIWGRFRSGTIASIPEYAAVNWVNTGIAISMERPDVIPEGMFWCENHMSLHKLDSKSGKKCYEYIEAEAADKALADEAADDAATDSKRDAIAMAAMTPEERAAKVTKAMKHKPGAVVEGSDNEPEVVGDGGPPEDGPTDEEPGPDDGPPYEEPNTE